MSSQEDFALLERRLGYAETDLASARHEVADADDRAAHYYRLLVAAEAEVEALTARVAELERRLSDAPVGGDGSHWDGCWRSHLDCAVARVRELEEQVRVLKPALVFRRDQVREGGQS